MKKKIKDLTFEEIISIHNLSFCNECSLKDNDGACIRTGVTYNFSTEFLEKEIEIASSTLSDCIKEWEERGWKVTISKREIEIRDTKTLTYISIDKKDKAYWCSAYLPFEEHYLLSKTLKSLEVENDK